jgi:hypothetical protein
MAAKNGEKVTVEFDREKETKTAIRFSEVESDEPERMGTLYVKKYLLKRMGDPKRITVTLEAA